MYMSNSVKVYKDREELAALVFAKVGVKIDPMQCYTKVLWEEQVGKERIVCIPMFPSETKNDFYFQKVAKGAITPLEDRVVIYLMPPCEPVGKKFGEFVKVPLENAIVVYDEADEREHTEGTLAAEWARQQKAAPTPTPVETPTVAKVEKRAYKKKVVEPTPLPYKELGDENMAKMTLRNYACIHLRVPDSGIGWLDDLIRKAKE